MSVVEGRDLHCAAHPERPGAALCVSCRRVACAECATRWDGINYCADCLARRRADDDRGPARWPSWLGWLAAVATLAFVAVHLMAWVGARLAS